MQVNFHIPMSGGFEIKELNSEYTCSMCYGHHHPFNVVNSWRNMINKANDVCDIAGDEDNIKLMKLKLKMLPMIDIWAAYGPDFCLNGFNKKTKTWAWVHALKANFDRIRFVPSYPKIDEFNSPFIVKHNKLDDL